MGLPSTRAEAFWRGEMEVHLPTQSALPTAQQSQTATSTTSDAGATATLQKTPDNVVTAATGAESSNVRDDDAMRRQERSDRDLQIDTLENLKVSGLKTRIGYDIEDERVYLEILIPDTNEVLQRIPSESLLNFLAQQISKSVGLNPTIDSNGKPVSQSI